MKNKCGIDLSQKKVLVTERLGNYLVQNGYPNYDAYMEKAERNPSGPEAGNLINCLTTNHTYFMREFEHLEFMRERILPELKQVQAAERDLRIWSAAASTGEEPYTIAMVLLDFFGLEHSRWDTRILATDISQRVLLRAKEGIYFRDQVDPLPDKWKRRFFRQTASGQYEVRKELKQEIFFRYFNLMDLFPFKRKFHIIFLRNVMIYFDEQTRKQLVEKLYDFMESGGYLFVGKTESLEGLQSRFCHIEPSIYRK